MSGNSANNSAGDHDIRNPLRDTFLDNPRTRDSASNRRALIYKKVMSSDNSLTFMQDVRSKFETLLTKYCVKLAKEPVIDVLFSILSENQEPVPEKNVATVTDMTDPKSIFQITKDLKLPRNLVFPVADIDKLNRQPVVNTDQQISCYPLTAKINIRYNDGISADECFSDEHSTNFKVMKSLYRSGLPARSVLHSNFIKCADDDSNNKAHESDTRTQTKAETVPMDVCDADESSISSHDSSNSRSNDEFVSPMHPSKRRRKTRSASSDSNASIESLIAAMACQDDNVSFIDFTTMTDSNETSDDHMYLDIIIVCPDLEVCRFLSDTFGLVSLDDILVELIHSKKSSVKIPYAINESAAPSIRMAWKELVEIPNMVYHKTLRYIQTRISESLACGAHSIGITCSESARSYTEANTYALLHFEVFSPEFRYHFKMSRKEQTENKLIESCVALTEIVNLALSYDVSKRGIVKMKNQYFDMNISLLAVMPFYVLRSMCEHDISLMIIRLRNRGSSVPDTFFQSLKS